MDTKREKNATQIRPCALNGIDDNNNEASPMKDENLKKTASANYTHTFFIHNYCCILITMYEWNITTIVGSGRRLQWS